MRIANQGASGFPCRLNTFYVILLSSLCLDTRNVSSRPDEARLKQLTIRASLILNVVPANETEREKEAEEDFIHFIHTETHVYKRLVITAGLPLVPSWPARLGERTDRAARELKLNRRAGAMHTISRFVNNASRTFEWFVSFVFERASVAFSRHFSSISFQCENYESSLSKNLLTGS